MESKHKSLIIQYLEDNHLEQIIQTSIRTLIQNDLLPDNPFAALARHFAFYSAREDITNLRAKYSEVIVNTVLTSRSFEFSHITEYDDLIGLEHTMRYIDIHHTSKAITAFSDALVNIKRTQGHFKLDVIHCISGSLLYKNTLLEVPDVSTAPVEIRSECIVKGPRFDPCFTIFSDYIYEDISKLGSTNSLHIVLHFSIDSSTSQTRFSLQTISENKQNFLSELRACITSRKDCYLKVLLFSSDLDSSSLHDLSKKPSLEHYFKNSSHILEKIEYTLAHKYYSFHWIDSSQDNSVRSTAPIGLAALLSGVFLDQESAERYSNLFQTSREPVINSSYMTSFRNWKKEKAGRLYKEGKTIESLWELVNHVTTSNDIDKEELLLEIGIVFKHNSCRLYKITRMLTSLEKVIDMYYETNFKHYQRIAEAVFGTVRELLFRVFAAGSSGEMVMMKPVIDRMVQYITVNNSRLLNLHNSTIRVISKIKQICISLARNSTEMLIRQTHKLNALIQALSNSAQIVNPVDHYDLLQRKQSIDVISISSQLSNSSEFPDDVSVVSKYLMDTGVINLFMNTTKSLLLSYPLSPNPLKIYSMKLISAILRNDMQRKTDSEIVQMYTNKPVLVKGAIYTSAIDETLRKKSLPSLFSNHNLLRIADCGEISLMLSILKSYESSNMTERYMIAPGYEVTSTLAVVGKSLMNASLIGQLRNMWQVFEDLYIRGPSMNAASHMFVEYLMGYATWLHNKTPAVMIGFFTPFSDEPVASISQLTNSQEKSEIFSALLTIFQTNTPVWIQYLIPYSGNPGLGIPATYLSVFCFFNMHFYEHVKRSWTSLSDPHTFENFTKVFKSVQDYERWTDIVPYRPNSNLISETLLAELNLSFDRGQFYRGYIILLFIVMFILENI